MQDQEGTREMLVFPGALVLSAHPSASKTRLVAQSPGAKWCL